MGRRAETKSLGGQRSSAVALTVGAAGARAHSGKQGFCFGIKTKDVHKPLKEEERLDFAVCVMFCSQSLGMLSVSCQQG